MSTRADPVPAASAGEPTGTVTRRRIWTAVLVTLAVAGAHAWYGNRHNFYDLRIYFGAIRYWAHGHPLYAFSKWDQVQGPLGFTYPPFAAILMYPMAWLPLGVVMGLLFVINMIAIGVTTAWLIVPVADRHGWPRWYAIWLSILLVTTMEPIRETVTFGQINILLALLILADLLFLVPAGSRWAGVCTGVATAVKLTPAIFIVYLLLSRRFRAAAAACVSAVVVTGLAFAVAPHASWQYWSVTVFETNRIGHLNRIPNQSLMGALSRIADPSQPSRWVWLALVVAVVGYGLWRATRAARSGDELTGLTITGFVGSLVSPVSWQHHLYWFTPAVVVLLDAALARGARWRWYAWLGGITWVTVTVSVISAFDYGLSYRLQDSVEGFFISNWYVLLMLVLIPALPIRRWAARTVSPAAGLPVASAATRTTA